MSDEIDLAQSQEALIRDAQIQKAMQYTAPKACGKCLNCGELVESEMRWCDADCRTDFERRCEQPSRLEW